MKESNPKSGNSTLGRTELWKICLRQDEKGKRLMELLVEKELVSYRGGEKKAIEKIAHHIDGMYSNLNDLHHYQVSRTAVDIVEGPLTLQQCFRLKCMADVWGYEARVTRKYEAREV